MLGGERQYRARAQSYSSRNTTRAALLGPGMGMRLLPGLASPHAAAAVEAPLSSWQHQRVRHGPAPGNELWMPAEETFTGVAVQ